MPIYPIKQQRIRDMLERQARLRADATKLPPGWRFYPPCEAAFGTPILISASDAHQNGWGWITDAGEFKRLGDFGDVAPYVVERALRAQLSADAVEPPRDERRCRLVRSLQIKLVDERTRRPLSCRGATCRRGDYRALFDREVDARRFAAAHGWTVVR